MTIYRFTLMAKDKVVEWHIGGVDLGRDYFLNCTSEMYPDGDVRVFIEGEDNHLPVEVIEHSEAVDKAIPKDPITRKVEDLIKKKLGGLFG